jgi:hypothetical protein
MKKSFIFWFITVVCILASCTKEEIPDPSMVTEKAGHVNGPVVYLNPSGGDDTDALLAAVDAAAPGTTIQLVEGEYHFRYTEILGFNGRIKGAGRDKTFLMPYGLIEVLPQVNDLNMMPSWWRILGGNVTISDLAFRTGDGSLLADLDPLYGKALVTFITVNNYNLYYEYDNPSPMIFNVENVDFLGGFLDPDEIGYAGWPNNVIMCLWFGTDIWFPTEPVPLAMGTFRASNCRFETFGQSMEALLCGDKATVIADGNIISNCGWGAFFAGNYGSKLYLTNNIFTGSTVLDLYIIDWDWDFYGITDFPEKRCEYIIAGNTFNVNPGLSSLILEDDRGVAAPEVYLPTLALVKNNLFNLSEGSTAISCLNSCGIQLRNNRLTGEAAMGVYVDGSEVYDLIYGTDLGMGEAKNVLVIGNNFSGLTSTEATIVLGESSSDCTVVGNGKDDVIDQGTNNKIIGMNMVPGGNHAGPTIRDNFRMMPNMRHH